MESAIAERTNLQYSNSVHADSVETVNIYRIQDVRLAPRDIAGNVWEILQGEYCGSVLCYNVKFYYTVELYISSRHSSSISKSSLISEILFEYQRGGAR